MHGWRGAHAWCVRDERALHACARVQGAEQRAQAWQWRGEARCLTCLFVRDNSVATERNACLYRDLFARRRRRAGAFCAVRCPASALLRAAPCCSPFRAALTAAAWGASQCRHSQKPRSCKTEWKHLFLQRSWKRLATQSALATAARTTMAGHLTEQFQVLHGHLQAHIYNRRGHRSRSAKQVQSFSVRSWRSRSQHHLKHLPWLHLLHATMQHL